jgi:multiple sugar transport system substrate-binding protein
MPVSPPPSAPQPLAPPKEVPQVAGASAAGSGDKKPMMAQISGSPLKFLPFVVIGVILLAVVGFVAMRFLGGSSSTSVSTTPTTPSTNTSTKGTANPSTAPATTTGAAKTIVYWGLWEPSEVMTQVLQDFEKQNPGLKVDYRKQSYQDYRERLQTAIASQNGPDVFRFHASWTSMLRDELAPMPSSVMSAAEYRQTFVPAASTQLQLNGQIVGIPLMYDSLALYYNKDIFTAAGVQPPESWAELKTLASQLTVKSSAGIERGGLAIGNASNVEHFADIIGLLMYQNGADPANPTSVEAQDALKFYTNFVLADKVWDDKLPNSTVAFARQEAAMMFAPSWRIHEIMAINPSLKFGVIPVPTLGGDRLVWPTYWAEGVNSKGKNKDDSWKLLKYLSSADVMKKLYSEQSQVRTFGALYSRTDLAKTLESDPNLRAFYADSDKAKNWYLNSYTHDKGVNDNMIKYYEDAINAMLGGKKAEEVTKTLSEGVKQVLRQYTGQ